MKASTPAKSKSTYNADSVMWRRGLEGPRHDPSMYLGSADGDAVVHMSKEIIGNSVDEVAGGHGNTVTIVIDKDDTVTVTDNGRGIPVEPHPLDKSRSTVEIVFSELHAGGKGKGSGDAYDSSIGTHGLGAAVTNACSERFEAEVKRFGKIHRIKFAKGKLKQKLTVVGKCAKDDTGTTVKFKHDPAVLSGKPNWNKLVSWIEALSYFTPNVTYDLTIAPLKLKRKVCRKDGLTDWLRDHSPRTTDDDGKSVAADAMGKPLVVRVGSFDMALQWFADTSDGLQSFVSAVVTKEGGTHHKAVEQAITEVIGKFTTTKGAMKKAYKPEDLRAGLVGCVNVRIKSPKFTSQTKEKLASPEGHDVVYREAKAALTAYFDKNKKLAKLLIERANGLRGAFDEYKMNAKAAAKLKTKRGTHGLPSKLHNCKSNKAEECELYLVEGDGAGGTAKNARDVTFQAVLPLKGKPPNVISGNLEKILATNEEVLNILRSIGYDPSNKKGPLEKLRFGKIIILADADVDGKHITNLVLATLWKLTPSLIREGRVFIVSDALFMAKTATKTVFGRTRKEAIEKSGAKNPVITRIKGWGELNATDMTPIAFDRKERQLIRVTPEQHEKLLKVMSEDAKFKRELLGV